MKSCKIEVYEAKDGYRWRLKAANGATIADSGEAYTKRPVARLVAVKLHQASLDAYKHATMKVKS